MGLTAPEEERQCSPALAASSWWMRARACVTSLSFSPWGSSSVNFDYGYVLVHQSVHADTAKTKETKTKDVRKVPIEATLVPLLREMHRQAKGKGSVVAAMPPRESLAARLRKYLGWAGVTRADLFADDATRRPLNFHDLRHTGITWRAVRSDNHVQIMRAAGHDDLATTQRYINEAQTFEPATFGEPFPPSRVSAWVSAFRLCLRRKGPIFPGRKGVPTWMNLEPRWSSWRLPRSLSPGNAKSSLTMRAGAQVMLALT
jgi:Phage integrase family